MNEQQANWRNKYTTMAIIGALTALMTGCSLLPQEEQPLAPPLVKPVKVPYTTAKVVKGSIENIVSGTANFVALKQYNLVMAAPTGRITEINVQPGQKVKQGQVILKTDTSDLQYQLQLAQIQLEKDQLNVKQLQLQKASAYQNDSANLDVQSDQLHIGYLNKQISEGSLVSPIAGVITSLTSHHIGDQVTPYETLAAVADLHELVLDYDSPDGQDITTVDVGMPVRITYNGQKVTGRVVEKNTNANGSDVHLIMSLDQLPSGAKMGDSADYAIVTQHKASTLVIPKDALNTDFGSDTVRVLSGQSVAQVSVQPGIETGTQVEILSGLKAGQTVILH